MTWTETLNTQPATGAVFVFALINAIVAAGGAVLSDSDGTTYSSTGTAVTHSGTGAGGLANNRAWRRVRLPSGQQLVFQRSTASNLTWRVCRSRVLGFAGTGTATQIPSADDAVIELGGGTDAAPTFATLIGRTDGSSWWAQIRVESTAPYRVLAIGYDDHGAGHVHTVFAMDSVRMPAGTTDPDPYVVIAIGGTLGSDVLEPGTISDDSGAKPAPHALLGGSYQVVTAAPLIVDTGSATVAPLDVPISPLTAKWDLLPLTYVRRGGASNPNGVKGESTLFRWTPLAAHVTGDTYSVFKADDRIVLSNVVALWGGTSVQGQPSNVAPISRGAASDWAVKGALPDEPAPLVVWTFPQPGNVVHRNDALSFSVTDDSGAMRDVLVIVKFPSGQWELAHDGTSFSSLYAAYSSRSVVTNGYAYQLRRSPGWPQSPTIDIRAIDTAGAENV
jgi:hypothetical protein